MDPSGKYHLPILSARVAGTPSRVVAVMAMATAAVLVAWSSPARGAPLGLGEACERATDCESAFCADGVCCQSACDEACFACSPAWGSSAPSGTCGPVEAGIDLRDDCAPASANTCRETGLCDGAGACAIHDEGTPCGLSGRCAEGVCDNVPLCDQDQTILGASGPIASCAPMRCSTATNACIQVCVGNRDCVDGFACSVEGRCEAAVAEGAGEGCSASRSGHLQVDGGGWIWTSLFGGLGAWLLRRGVRGRVRRGRGAARG